MYLTVNDTIVTSLSEIQESSSKLIQDVQEQSQVLKENKENEQMNIEKLDEFINLYKNNSDKLQDVLSYHKQAISNQEKNIEDFMKLTTELFENNTLALCNSSSQDPQKTQGQSSQDQQAEGQNSQESEAQGQDSEGKTREETNMVKKEDFENLKMEIVSLQEKMNKILEVVEK